MSNDQNNIFNPDATPSDSNSSNNNLSDKVGDLVGEGKKYATEAEALNALVHSQTHISTIEAENQTLRKQLEDAKKVEDVLSKLDAKVDANLTPPTQDENPVDIDALLEEKLTAREKNQLQTSNQETVNGKMVEMFGEAAQDKMVAKANELGMSVKQMKGVAQNSPNAFLAWFDAPVTSPTQSTDTDVNTTNFQPSNQVEPGTYAFYEKMRKENPSQYYDSNTQFRMTQEAATNPNFMG